MSLTPDNLPSTVVNLAQKSLAADDPSAWFDPFYQQADRDAALVPWAKLAPHPQLQQWLETQPPLPQPQSAPVSLSYCLWIGR